MKACARSRRRVAATAEATADARRTRRVGAAKATAHARFPFGGSAVALLLAWSMAGVACGGASPAATFTAPLAPLHLSPVADLAPAASLGWLVDAKPRAFFAHPELVEAVRTLFPDDRFETFTRRHGGVDVRQLDELVIASYPKATLVLAHGLFDPSKVESAFAARTARDGRSVDRQSSDPRGTIVRTWGTVTTTSAREQIAMLGREAVGLESGHFGPLRAAELFAEARLKKAAPALKGDPLAGANEALGPGEVRAFAPGPFVGEWAHALGGLLAGSTAVAVSVSFAAGDEQGGRLAVRVVVMGAWKDAAAAAGIRLSAAIDTLAASAIGKLCELDKPILGTTVRVTDDALVADLTLRARPVFRGLKAATGASVEDVMSY